MRCFNTDIDVDKMAEQLGVSNFDICYAINAGCDTPSSVEELIKTEEQRIDHSPPDSFPALTDIFLALVSLFYVND